MVLNIGGIIISFKGVNNYFINRSKDFMLPENIQDSCDMEMGIDYSYEITLAEGEVIVNDNPIWIKTNRNDMVYGIYVSNMNTGDYNLSVEASQDWSKVKLRMLDPGEAERAKKIKLSEFQSFLYAGVAYRNRLIKMNGLQIHSSSIDYMGNGIIFSAPSGTGKSTHTGMWKEIYGDAVNYINDDRPAVRFIDGKAMLCGTPWSGKSDLFTNTIVPLKCIVMLEQSPENKIFRLTKEKALHLLMPRCFLPYFDQEMMEEAICILERIIDDIPVLHLHCRPDHEAVELVRKWII